MDVQPFLSMVLICSKTGEQLTSWTHVQPILSVVLLKHWRATHSLDVCSAILVNGSDLPKHWRVTHSLEVCPAISHQWFWSIQTQESNSLPRCISIYLISENHVHLWQSYWFALQNHLSDFINFCRITPHTYCQHSISLTFPVIQQDIVLTFWTTYQPQMRQDHNWFHLHRTFYPQP